MKRNLLNSDSKIFKVFFSALVVSLLLSVRITAQTDAVIYFDSTKQVIRGFGANNIVGWRPDMTPDQITKAFGTGEGQLGFSILRLRISYNSNDFSLNVPTALAAHNLGVTIIASPWTPPAWMKTNNNIVGGRLNDTSYASYAAHLKSFADYMADNDIPVYAVSVQNEPDVSVTYESCDWNAAEMLRFMKDFAPSVGYPVFCPESYQFIKTISNEILNDSVATAHTAFIGGHIYGGGLVPYPLAENKGKELWMTEHLVLDTNWTANLATGKEISDCMNAGMSAYIWWYIVRFYGPIKEDGSISKRGYVMSQFSRFIRPEYVRLKATTNPQTGVYVTAYKKGEKIVIVAINNNSSPVAQTFNIQNGLAGIYTPYVTSQIKNCIQEGDIEAANGSFTISLEGSSITTFVSDGDPNIPVELVSFSANASINNITLSWQTATELNNYGFEIQRSINKNDFVTVGFVKGIGTTSETHAYTYVDNNINGKFYYRLKQVDFNGTFEYSDIVEVTTVPDKFSLSQNYPNPFNSVTHIKYSVPESGFLSLKVYNLLGEEAATLFEGYRQAGSYIFEFNAGGLTSGVYFYQLRAGNPETSLPDGKAGSGQVFMETKKFILLK